MRGFKSRFSKLDFSGWQGDELTEWALGDSGWVRNAGNVAEVWAIPSGFSFFEGLGFKV